MFGLSWTPPNFCSKTPSPRTAAPIAILTEPTPTRGPDASEKPMGSLFGIGVTHNTSKPRPTRPTSIKPWGEGLFPPPTGLIHLSLPRRHSTSPCPPPLTTLLTSVSPLLRYTLLVHAHRSLSQPPSWMVCRRSHHPRQEAHGGHGEVWPLRQADVCIDPPRGVPHCHGWPGRWDFCEWRMFFTMYHSVTVY